MNNSYYNKCTKLARFCDDSENVRKICTVLYRKPY